MVICGPQIVGSEYLGSLVPSADSLDLESAKQVQLALLHAHDIDFVTSLDAPSYELIPRCMIA